MVEQAICQKTTQRGYTGRQLEITRQVVLPIIGMAMFWPMFRYPSFMQVLFPSTLSATVLGHNVTFHVVQLCLLASLAALAFRFAAPIARWIPAHRLALAAMTGAGSIGALLSVLVQAGRLPDQLLWPATLLVALGFLSSYIAWASHFIDSFRPTDLVVIVGSFFLSYLCFSYSTVIGTFLGPTRACVLMPIGTALAWLFSKPADSTADTEPPVCPKPMCALPNMRATLFAIAAMLLIGAAVRGISYLHAPTSDVRLRASLALCTLWLVASVTFCAAVCHKNGKEEITQDHVAEFALMCWCAISLVFLAGLFTFLCLGITSLGSDLVIAARTAMGVALWLLLCDMSASMSQASALRAFLAFGLATETVSWLLSHAVVPAVLGPAAATPFTPEIVVLSVIFGVVTAILTGFMVKLAFTARKSTNANDMRQNTAEETETQQQDSHESDEPSAISESRLTEREAEVVMRYARGISLGKVADELGITKSTAQSHIKNAYRKLGVHSRDELIERLDG